MKIVVNRCFGGFGVTKAVYDELGLEYDGYGYPDNELFGIVSSDYMAYRTHPSLIDAIEKIGVEKSSSGLASLEVIDIPDDIEWEIDEYDGIETVREQHRSW